ncbi:putative Acyl-CoA dehydrogenase [Seiridium cardinale]|uniref:Acyl-CoA dehydrogenase n=1 Tax=Seiridium cardinale TaxID=138064 RepID=A0ABR2X5Y1_9PEZI
MSAQIPALVVNRVSDKAKKALDTVAKFVEEECIPADPVLEAQIGEGSQRWDHHPAIVDDLKTKAKKLGLWNMFFPKGHYKESPGYTNLEYGLMAEWLGKSRVASEACNCAAPDTGNMEVLAKYGNEEQKAQWLKPLMDGEIRSAFLMTEPEVASSDATNIQLNIRKEGNEYVLNGSKWWSSGAGDPRCKIYIVMGKTDPENKDVYKQQSVVLVPANTKGITIHRMLSVYGYDDAPHGHGHISFKNVRVPVSSMVLGEGRGFEIIQGRLGPGRIHHAMRSIGAAERALEWMLMRINDPQKTPFKKQLKEHGVILEWVAKSRLEIDAARLIVLNAAVKMDDFGPKATLKEIAEAKVLVPQTALTVIDRAVQAFGGAGVSQDTPLANMWAQIRTLRLADGPDEVHLNQMGRNENKRGKAVTQKILGQKQKTDQLLKQYGVQSNGKNIFCTQAEETTGDSTGLTSCNLINHALTVTTTIAASTSKSTALHIKNLHRIASQHNTNDNQLRDINTHGVQMGSASADNKGDVKSMEYHRQVLQSKMEKEKDQQTYVSPSDGIMSPCTAKLNALRNKQVGKTKPKSLFAQASAKKFEGENVLGAKSASRPFGV